MDKRKIAIVVGLALCVGGLVPLAFQTFTRDGDETGVGLENMAPAYGGGPAVRVPWLVACVVAGVVILAASAVVAPLVRAVQARAGWRASTGISRGSPISPPLFVLPLEIVERVARLGGFTPREKRALRADLQGMSPAEMGALLTAVEGEEEF